MAFDLQCYLYQVFHTTWTARLGHLFGMTSEVLFLLAAATSLPLTSTAPGLHGGHALAAVLCAWHGAVALRAGLRLWALLALAMPIALLATVEAVVVPALHATAAGGGPAAVTSALLAALASAAVVACSHLPEPTIPPRAISGHRWRSVPDYVLGWGEAPLSALHKLGRGLRVAAFLPLGVVNEAWAGLRLMPYGWLFVAMRLGYAPVRWAELQAREAAGLASGQPAPDYVGVGGDARFAPEAGRDEVEVRRHSLA